MSRRARLARALAVGAFLGFSTVSTAWGMLFFAPLPTIDGHYRLLGLSARAEVVRDLRGVAHIYAADPHDLFFLQGYVTAQDRLVQLEQLRRDAHRRAPAAARPGGPVAGAAGAALEAYAAGITKLIAQYDEAGVLPGELVLAGIRPSPWAPRDSLAIASAFGATGARCIGAPPTATASGASLVAVDIPFAGPSPGLHEIGLASAGSRAVGIALPGVPGLIAGYNGSVAWALARSEPAAPAVTLDALLRWQGATRIDGAFTSPAGPRVVEGCGADASALANAVIPEPLAPGSDIEAMRVHLGRPAGAGGARLIVDLADPEATRSALSHGVSGLRLSSHHEDQRAIWEIGQLRALPLSRPAIAVTDGRLVLRAR